MTQTKTTTQAHEFVNSDLSKYDSNCSVCGGKERDCAHNPNFWEDIKQLGLRHEYFTALIKARNASGCPVDMVAHAAIKTQPWYRPIHMEQD